ncbi:esterase/lipase family protein [Lentzea sp. NPDC058450]|uniref:esterase/lipase family protein n=1 Tax=Lentzea sp. NPDC058450 TaxID=3346505 RepID=UPI00364C09C9
MTVEPSVVRDVVVVVPGIMGSALVDARDRPVWSVGLGSLVQGIRTLGASVTSLTLPDDIGDNAAPDGVRATGLLGGLHVIPGVWSPVAGYAGLMNFLRGRRFHLVEPGQGRIPNLLAFAYDWRLSNRYNAVLLKKMAVDALERWRTQPGMSEAKLVLVCHSMGGLVGRWFLDHEGGAEITRSLITIGTPHRGSVNALEKLVNGVGPGIGGFRDALTEFVRSMPSLHQLLPTYDCLQLDGKREAIRDLPGVRSAMLTDARDFHASLALPNRAEYVLHKVVGTRQPTSTTARIDGERVVVSERIDDRDQGGDGTVPRLAAEPEAGRGVEVHEVAEQHGELQNTRSALDLVDGIITREELIWQDVPAEAFGVSMAEIWSPRETPELLVPDVGGRRLRVVVLDEQGDQVGAPAFVDSGGRAELAALPPGGYRARVESPLRGGPPPVTRPFLVWDPDTSAEE